MRRYIYDKGVAAQKRVSSSRTNTCKNTNGQSIYQYGVHIYTPYFLRNTEKTFVYKNVGRFSPTLQSFVSLTQHMLGCDVLLLDRGGSERTPPHECGAALPDSGQLWTRHILSTKVDSS